MTQVNNQMILDKLNAYIEKNDADHNKIMKMLLGNGEIGLLERDRIQARQLKEHSEKIEFIEENYSRRKTDTKWQKMPFYQKALVFVSLAGIFNIDALLELLKLILK